MLNGILLIYSKVCSNEPMTGREELNLRGSSSGEFLAKNGFTLFTGWDEVLAQQLFEGARQPRINSHYPEDARRRFPTPEGAEEWYQAKPRVIYSLAIESQLAGAIWFSAARKKGSDAGYTSSIRIYNPGRVIGRRATSQPSIDFAEEVHDHFDKSHHSKGVWIDVGTSDASLIKLLDRLDYVRNLGLEAKQLRTIMVRQRSGKTK
jgi:hypothetical protein